MIGAAVTGASVGKFEGSSDNSIVGLKLKLGTDVG